MSSESRNIKGTVETNTHSAERVAFDLYKYIRNASPENQDKELELFSRCIMHVTMPTYGLEAIRKMAAQKN